MRIFLISLIIFFSVCGFKIQKSAIENNFRNGQSFADCNSTTNFDFISLDYLAKNTYMNQTLKQAIAHGRITLQGALLDINQTDNYSINPYSWLKLKWLDQNQTASFGQNQLILIEGGIFEIEIEFQWYHFNKNRSLIIQGKGIAHGFSRQIPFSINALSSGFQLGSMPNIVFQNVSVISANCSNDKSAGCSVSSEDMFVLNYLISKGPSNASVVGQFQHRFNSLIRAILQDQICCQYSPTKSYNYTISDIGTSEIYFNVQINLNNRSIYVDKTGSKPGVYYTFLSQINAGDSCGIAPPHTPLDPIIFGGGQQFIAFTFFENLLKIGIQKKQLDTYFYKINWSTKKFRFSVAELASFLSNINQTFNQSAVVFGQCQTDRTTFKISKGSNNSTVKAFIRPTCMMKIRESNDTNILGFTLNLTLSVVPSFLEHTFEVWVDSFVFDVVYDDSYGFNLTNRTFADEALKEAVNRLSQRPLFGSGLPYLMAQKNPVLYVLENAVLIYDKPQKNQPNKIN